MGPMITLMRGSSCSGCAQVRVEIVGVFRGRMVMCSRYEGSNVREPLSLPCHSKPFHHSIIPMSHPFVIDALTRFEIENMHKKHVTRYGLVVRMLNIEYPIRQSEGISGGKAEATDTTVRMWMRERRDPVEPSSKTRSVKISIN